MSKTLGEDVEELRRALRALGHALAESLGIPRLLAWLSRQR